MSAIDLQARLAAAKAARDAAVAAITDEDRTEQADRAELARLDAEREDAEREKRELDIARRLDALQEAHPAIRFKTVLVKNFKDSFIIRHDQKAWAKYQKAVNAPRTDYDECARTLAAAAVVDWNGETDFSDTSLKGGELIEFFRQNSGIANLVSLEAGELAGIYKEERKRG